VCVFGSFCLAYVFLHVCVLSCASFFLYVLCVYVLLLCVFVLLCALACMCVVACECFVMCVLLHVYFYVRGHARV